MAPHAILIIALPFTYTMASHPTAVLYPCRRSARHGAITKVVQAP